MRALISQQTVNDSDGKSNSDDDGSSQHSTGIPYDQYCMYISPDRFSLAHVEEELSMCEAILRVRVLQDHNSNSYHH